jgi:hypothetical protein
MAALSSWGFKALPRRLADEGFPQGNLQRVGDQKSLQKASEALILVNLQFHSADAKMVLEISTALFHSHPAAVQLHDVFRRQSIAASGKTRSSTIFMTILPKDTGD